MISGAHSANEIPKIHIHEERVQKSIHSNVHDKIKKGYYSNGAVTSACRKRVIIHLPSRMPPSAREQFGKLINLPDSLEELFKIAGKKKTTWLVLLNCVI